MFMLLQTAPSTTPGGAGMDFFGGAKVLMDTLEGKILQQLATVVPVKSVFNILWIVIVCIFFFHFAEAFLDASKRGTSLSWFGALKQVVLTRGMRIFIYCTLAVGALYVLNSGWAVASDAQNNMELMQVPIGPSGQLMSDSIGNTMTNYMGTNDTRSVLDPATNTYKMIVPNEAPCMQSLDGAIKATDAAINGMSATQIFDEISTQVTNIVNQSSDDAKSTSTAIDVGTVLGGGSQGILLLVLKPIIDGFFWVVNWFTFVWAQWTLCRTLLIQALFIKLAWHIGLYFLPIFILMAYFRSLQGFLIRLLTNFVALMIAAYVLGALAQALFAPATWIGTAGANGALSGGIIQMAFANVKLGGGAQGFTAGSFPWLSTTYATQIARGQLIWLMGAIGILLSQVYEMVKGVLDGSFRSFFNPGGAGRGSVFGG